jgi:hypothetical protein
MGSASKRTMTHRQDETGLRGLLACPKWERIGAGSLIPDQCSLPRNPVESTALKLRKTGTRNVITTLGSPYRSITEQVSTASQGVVGLPKKLRPGVITRIC